jgi:hypothetical protein
MVRLQLVDVLRTRVGKECVCELVPLFEISQPTVFRHLKVLREAGSSLGAPEPVGLVLRDPRRTEGSDMAAFSLVLRRQVRARGERRRPNGRPPLRRERAHDAHDVLGRPS